MTKSKIIILISAVVVIALLAGLWLHHNTLGKPAVLKTATVLTPARDISDFQLTGDNDKPFTLSNLKGHWTLIFFGFTHCPELCPTTLATLKEVYQKLENAKQKPMPQVLFISVDPARDSPKLIKRYLSSFNSNFLGATGTEEALKSLTQEMSVLYMKVMQPGHESNDQAHYDIDHSGTLLLTNPAGKLVAIFNMPHQEAQIAADLHTIIKYY